MPSSSPGLRPTARLALTLLVGVGLLTACSSDPTGPASGTDLSGATPAVTATARIAEFGEFALYLPTDVPRPRAILVALGGPDTRGYVTGGSFGAPPFVEPGLQAQGRQFRQMAAEQKLAILGTSLAALPNSPASDEVLLAAIHDAAVQSGHPELDGLPILVYGISGGGEQASGFAARNPDRMVGAVLKVPVVVASVGGGPAAAVPTLVLLAEFDPFVDNASVTQVFHSNRAGGAYWGLVMEPGAPHYTVSPTHLQLTLDWMNEIVGMRLRGASGQPLRPVDATSGWLGDPATGALVPSGAFRGDPTAASWLPSRSVAQEWKLFGGFGV